MNEPLRRPLPGRRYMWASRLWLRDFAIELLLGQIGLLGPLAYRWYCALSLCSTLSVRLTGTCTTGSLHYRDIRDIFYCLWIPQNAYTSQILLAAKVSKYACLFCGDGGTRLDLIVSSVPGQSTSYLTSSFPLGTTSASGYAEPFSLNSNSMAGGTATATWEGTATNFTFEDRNLSATPEPGTMLLFGTGLLAITKAARKKRPHAC
jgi:PEP-CTERM motif